MQLADAIHIGDWSQSRNQKGERRFSAHVDGAEVHYAVSAEIDIVPRAEPFVAPLLLAAMASGRDIEVDKTMPLSPRLHARLPEIQRLFRLWAPHLDIVEVRADLTAQEAISDLSASLWSGGVDSMQTLARRGGEIDALLMANFFDTARTAENDARKRAALADICDATGKRPLFVGSNIRDHLWERHAIDMPQVHGAIMCGLAAGIGLKTLYFPASYSYRELKPWGSHPLLDPLWSTEFTEIVHDSADLRRSEKTVEIARHPDLLSRLQVCWKSGTENCGVCSKCVRTKVILDAIGADGPFPDIDPMAHVDTLKPSSDLGAAFVWDIQQFARERELTGLADEMSALLSGYKRKRALQAFLRAVTGKPGAYLKRKLRPADWQKAAIVFDDPDNF